MGKICEHIFERPSSENPDYSLVEYDLYAKLGLTIRKNLKLNRYEIVTIAKPRIVRHSSASIDEIAVIANKLEGEMNTIIECGTLHPKRRM